MLLSHARGWIALTLLATVPPVAHGECNSSEAAILESERTGRPIFAISTSPGCAPCLALKQTVHSDPRIRQLLQDFVVLEMSSSSPDFASFLSRFPGDYFGVPMVHIVSADQEVLYARSGNPPVDQLQQLLARAAAEPTSSPASTKQLETIRSEALAGRLTSALRQVMPLAASDPSDDDTLVARSYQRQLEAAISDWIDDLAAEIDDSSRAHGGMYRLAKLFTELPKQSTAREKALDLMRRLEGSEATRTAMQQAKRLVWASLEEDRRLGQAAIRSYEEVIRLDPSSPSGRYAKRRIGAIRQSELLTQAGQG